MNRRKIVPVVCALLLSASACHRTNSSSADSDITVTDTAATADINEEESDETDSRTFMGTIGDEKVVITYRAIGDSPIEEWGNTSFWEIEGTLSYTSSGTSYKLKGLSYSLHFEFDLYNANGEKVGNLDYMASGDDWRGTFTDLKTGKELDVILHDVD